MGTLLGIEVGVGERACEAKRLFEGVVTGCCLGKEGEVACQCDALERVVHGLSAGRGMRSLSKEERNALVAEVRMSGVMDETGCEELGDRDLAVVLEGSWHGELQD